MSTKNFGRKNKVTVDSRVFLDSCIEYHKAGKTIKDIAGHFNMSEQGCYQKYNKISKDLKAKGVDLPRIPLKPSGRDSVDSLAEFAKNKLLGMKTELSSQ